MKQPVSYKYECGTLLYEKLGSIIHSKGHYLVIAHKTSKGMNSSFEFYYLLCLEDGRKINLLRRIVENMEML